MRRSGRVVAALAAAVCGLAASPSRAQVPPPAEYRNPVYDVDFADPFVLKAAGGWYAYATHRGLANIQIAHSGDLVSWRDVGTALPVLPTWAIGPLVWAPAVLPRGNEFVLYYAVRERATELFCISVATASLPSGPFIDRSNEPLVCQRDRGGTIDPSPFVDADGIAYLLFKSDGIAGAEPTRLWAQRLRPDGLALEGEWPSELLTTGRPWEGPIVENPAMSRDADGGYHLLYSGGEWATASYAVGWADCDTPLGPCVRGAAEPVLRASGGVNGPGGADFFRGPTDELWISYHGWIGDDVGYPAGRRALLIQRITFAEGRPWLDGPTLDPVPFDRAPGPPPPTPPPPPVAAAAASSGAVAAESPPTTGLPVVEVPSPVAGSAAAGADPAGAEPAVAPVRPAAGTASSLDARPPAPLDTPPTPVVPVAIAVLAAAGTLAATGRLAWVLKPKLSAGVDGKPSPPADDWSVHGHRDG